ncbi:MAG: hypothetical protein RRC34_08500 [Lentisphaeria bacterium]|nr:hypothetical protein [Lentisphaeria bacterium]
MKKFVMCLCVFALSGYVFAQADDVKAIKEQQAALKKSLAQVQKRLNLQKDPELVTLKQAVQDAQKAYNDAAAAKVKADPEGAEIIQRLEALEAQTKALQPAKGKKEKPAKAEKPAKKGPGKKGKKNNQDDGEGQEDPQVDIFN